MPRPRGRRYTADHDQAARQLKAAMPDGHPCCRCGRPMYRWQLALDRNDIRGIDADHYQLARVLGGALPDALAHRRCNRSAGAKLGNSMRPRRVLPEW